MIVNGTSRNRNNSSLIRTTIKNKVEFPALSSPPETKENFYVAHFSFPSLLVPSLSACFWDFLKYRIGRIGREEAKKPKEEAREKRPKPTDQVERQKGWRKKVLWATREEREDERLGKGRRMWLWVLSWILINVLQGLLVKFVSAW